MTDGLKSCFHFAQIRCCEFESLEKKLETDRIIPNSEHIAPNLTVPT